MNQFTIRRTTLASALLISLLLAQCVFAQLSGSRGGVFGAHRQNDAALNDLNAVAAQSVIMVQGKSVMSVEPSEIRIVLALTFEGLSSGECKSGMKEKIALLRPKWSENGVAEEKIVEDFISILPRYEIDVQKLGDKEVAMEKKSGYVMQTNIHVAVKDDAEAMKVLDVAFENGITDIIGFDYWSDELDQKKQDVRTKAIQAAKEKSEVMLGLFAEKPPVINVQENTVVVYPESMYQSFSNSSSAEYQTNYNTRRNLPLIRLPRPKNTYYRGNLPNADIQADELPMRAKLSVVSTVQIYYQSPAAESFNAGRKE